MKGDIKIILLIIPILIIIGIMLINYKHRKHRKRKKTRSGLSNNNSILNNVDNGFGNVVPLGETLGLKQFSTFSPNMELFNKPTSSFYKKEPYVFLKQSIKEGNSDSTLPARIMRKTPTSYLENMGRRRRRRQRRIRC